MSDISMRWSPGQCIIRIFLLGRANGMHKQCSCFSFAKNAVALNTQGATTKPGLWTKLWTGPWTGLFFSLK